MRRVLAAAALFVPAAALWLPGSAVPQGLLGAGNGDAGPVEIEATEGIEWLRDEQQYIARGDAKAKRGNFEVRADVLTAHYREDETTDGQQIHRLDADGSVIIETEGEVAYGDQGVYHVLEKIVVLVGKDLRFESAQAIITAQDSLEFWEADELAVARGNATVITTDERRLRADVMTAYIMPDANGKKSVQRIDAIGNVHVSTGQEIVLGREGVYEIDREIATICGNVRITRGDNQLNGDCAEVEMNTGRSRLLGGGQRLKALILPTE